MPASKSVVVSEDGTSTCNDKKGKTKRSQYTEKEATSTCILQSGNGVDSVHVHENGSTSPCIFTENENAVTIITECSYLYKFNDGTRGGQKIERTFCRTQAHTLIFEPLHRKTNNLHMRKQGRRSPNCTADHRLCFRNPYCIIPFLLKSEISSF